MAKLGFVSKYPMNQRFPEGITDSFIESAFIRFFMHCFVMGLLK